MIAIKRDQIKFLGRHFYREFTSEKIGQRIMAVSRDEFNTRSISRTGDLHHFLPDVVGASLLESAVVLLPPFKHIRRHSWAFCKDLAQRPSASCAALKIGLRPDP